MIQDWQGMVSAALPQVSRGQSVVGMGIWDGTPGLGLVLSRFGGHLVTEPSKS